jgi:pimeloyl-ACP methyl ester carboxylesterase
MTRSDLAARTVSSARHRTQYWEAGPIDGPLMIFLHGWPGNGLLWRAQVEAFASLGWHCVAPDMRGYAGSSAPTTADGYAIQEIVGDMVELHEHLGAHPAVWVGHDLGSRVAAALAAHHAARAGDLNGLLDALGVPEAILVGHDWGATHTTELFYLGAG